MSRVIESFNAITTKWLEEVLGAPAGTISSFTITSSWETPVTQVALVHISTKDTDPKVPRSVFIKISKREQNKELQRMCGREVPFYSQIACLMESANIPRCYFAEKDDESGRFNIVLEDLSPTHFQTEYPLPPTIGSCKMAIDCIAKVHTTWWNKKGPEVVLGKYPEKEGIIELTTYFRRTWAVFSAFMEDRLSQTRRLLIEKSMDNIERGFSRVLECNNLTLIHKDTHLWNFFFPKHADGVVKLIDWQFYEYGLGVDDLIPMIALNWYPERRQRFETTLLSRYHEALVNNGITDFSWEQLLTEYRWAVVRAVAIPIMQWDHEISAFIWFNNLEKILLAFQDLSCMDLLE